MINHNKNPEKYGFTQYTALKLPLIITLSCLIFSCLLSAATIVVDGSDGTVADDGVCGIVEAINSANDDAASGMTLGECVAGSGADTIELTQDVTLNVAAVINDAFDGSTGLPYINSTITLNGMGYQLKRDENLICNADGTVDDSEFRLIFIESSGALELKDIMLSHGCADGDAIADRFFGGTIWNDGQLLITDSVINFGKAAFGAGIINTDTINGITNSIFSDNVTSQSGGAIYNNFNGTITLIKNSQFIDNETTDREGGALYNRGVINSIQNSSFIDNYAVSFGGAIYTNANINTIVNSTFSGNRTDRDGGAISNGEILHTINNSTFVNNSGDFGGAIDSSSHATVLNNSLFSGNSSMFSSSADCYASGGSTNPPVFSGTNNLSNQDSQNCQNTITSGLTAATIDTLRDNGCVTVLADGTCVQTHQLFNGSEALDAADVNTASITDQREFAIENKVRDMGAYEANVDFIFADGFE